MSNALIRIHCPDHHEAAILCLAHRLAAGAVASGDALGVVAVTPPGEQLPRLRLGEGAAIHAVALSSDGRLVAWGDAAGTVAVHRTDDGSEVWREAREGDAGRARAPTSLAFHRDGHLLASLGADGRIRLTDIPRRKRVGTFETFEGRTLQFEPTGELLLAVDETGQVQLLDPATRELFARPGPPGGVRLATFTPDGRWIVAAGHGGLAVIDPYSTKNEPHACRQAQGSSGIGGLVVSPDGSTLAAITGRSVHTFALPQLHVVESVRHGAPSPAGAAYWDEQGVAVAGSDGRIYRPGQAAPLPPSVAVAGVGDHRAVAHGHKLAMWDGNRRRRPITPVVVEPDQNIADATPLRATERIVEIALERDGRLLAALPEGRPVHVYAADSGKLIFQTGADTTDSPAFAVGGAVVVVARTDGGVRWFDLDVNQTFELEWPEVFALTGGGTWVAFAVPDGRIMVLDPATGRDAMAPTTHPHGLAATQLAFVHRRPELIVVDSEGGTWLVDLSPLAGEGEPASWYPLGSLQNAAVDAAWGVPDGRRVVLRVQQDERCEMWWIDVDSGSKVGVTEVLPWATFDPDHSVVLEPAISGALLERDAEGRERRVLRSLPEGDWVAYERNKVLDRSDGAGRWLS